MAAALVIASAAAQSQTPRLERLWRVPASGGTSPLEDWLVVLSETSGLVRLVRADRDRYQELARLDALTPGAPAPGPATVSDDAIYARSAEEVVALRVVRWRR